MVEKEFEDERRAIRKAVVEEANRCILENMDLMKELHGDVDAVTPEMASSALDRLWEFDREDHYGIRGLIGKDLGKKLLAFQRFDAAVVLKDFAQKLELRSLRYSEPLLWYHIGVFRTFLFCTAPENKPSNFWEVFSPPITAEVEGIIESALPEIKKIYSAIKSQVGFSGRLGGGEEAEWKAAALEGFKDSKKGFKLVKQGHLEDPNLYRFAETQQKRDFEEKLLQKIVENETGVRYGSPSLRKTVRRIRARKRESK